MRADKVLTVTMTESVHHELTLTAERLADITGIPVEDLDGFIADHGYWTCLANPHGEAVESLLDAIDRDTYFACSEDRSWQVRPSIATPTPSAVPDPTARAIASVIATYNGNTYRLLAALADQLQLSLAYVDRHTVEAHVERALSDGEWAATNEQFTALDFDEHVGDHGTFRTDWIETVLEKAGVPGYGYTGEGWYNATERGGMSVRHLAVLIELAQKVLPVAQ